MNKSKEYNWRIDNEIKEIFTENILAEDSGFDLYKMSPSANDINVRYGDALFTGDNSNGILETQMINDMKYMTFENLALEVMEKFKKQEEAQKEVDASEDFQDIQEDISKLDDEMEDIRSGEEHIYGLMTLMGVNTYDSDKQFPKFKKIFESSSEISANRIIGKVKTKNAFEYLKKVNDKNVMKDADDFYKTDFFYTLTNVLYVKMLISANDIQAQKDIERYNKEYKDWQNSGGSNNQGENSKPPPEPLKLWEKEKYANKLSKFDKDIKDYKDTFNRLIVKINDNAKKARIEITKNRSKFEKIEKDLKALKIKVEALPNNQEFKPTMKKEIEDLLEDVKRERLDELTKAFTKTEEACRYISGNGSTSMIDKFGNELKPIEDKIKNKEIKVKLSDKDRKDLYRYMKDGTINSATADAIVLGKVGINNNDVKNKITNKLKPTFQKHFVNSNSLTKSNRKSFTFELELKLKHLSLIQRVGFGKKF
ncbi:hypothetical protein M4I33_10160 [Clostridium sp. LY3-2]|uniref:hypothetical protein n=1 Tax=Clostridium sp. LY3-2 TaxID=2942482 RepID=UPI0021523130|nr:hypothetical protein [Clostridium sp. LY3-2]MCR6515231.1 hypothetical protein [Clostridium sp. LY3-2]